MNTDLGLIWNDQPIEIRLIPSTDKDKPILVLNGVSPAQMLADPELKQQLETLAERLLENWRK